MCVTVKATRDGRETGHRGVGGEDGFWRGPVLVNNERQIGLHMMSPEKVSSLTHVKRFCVRCHPGILQVKESKKSVYYTMYIVCVLRFVFCCFVT